MPTAFSPVADQQKIDLTMQNESCRVNTNEEDISESPSHSVVNHLRIKNFLEVQNLEFN